MTRTLEDTADERARLANMALADCGLPEVVYVRWGEAIYTPGSIPDLAARKAGRLSYMHMHGHEAPVPCDGCWGTHITCERIPVADALRGRTCGKHGGTT